MASKTTLPHFSIQNSSAFYMFKNPMGKLKRHLDKGEYNEFKHVPMFESDFIQVSKRGEVVDVHNSVQVVTVGITFSSPSITLPDIMLLARPAVSSASHARHDKDVKGRGLKSSKSLELTRLLPLNLVMLSIYNHEKKQLRLKLATGRSFYLQLYTPSGSKEDLFMQWEDLLYLLRPPVEAYSGTRAEPAGDMMDIPVLEAEDKRSPAAMELHEEGQDQISIRNLHMGPEISGTSSLVYPNGEGIRPHASHMRCLLRNKPSFLAMVPAGSEHVAAPAAASAAPKGSMSMADHTREGETINRPVTETAEGPGAGLFVSASQSKGSGSEQAGGQIISHLKAEAPRNKMKLERASTERPPLLNSAEQKKSILKFHGTTQGGKMEKDPKGRGEGSFSQEYSTLSSTQNGSRLSQKMRRSQSKSQPGWVP